jgi:hypothetical protein
VLLANYVIRVAVQLPLDLAKAPLEVQIGVKLALGWPLLAAGVVVIGILLARGNTPIDQQALVASEPQAPSDEDAVQDGLRDVPAAGHHEHP